MYCKVILASVHDITNSLTLPYSASQSDRLRSVNPFDVVTKSHTAQALALGSVQSYLLSCTN